MVCVICNSRPETETIFNIDICQNCAKKVTTKKIQRALETQAFDRDELLSSLLMIDEYEGTLPPSVVNHLNYFLALSTVYLTKQYAKYFVFLALKRLKPIDRRSILSLLLIARR